MFNGSLCHHGTARPRVVDGPDGLQTLRVEHDNHVTLLATIYLRANTTHVFIFTTCFAAMRHHQVKPNTIHQIISRY
jgi:hypothetical protein